MLPEIAHALSLAGVRSPPTSARVLSHDHDRSVHLVTLGDGSRCVVKRAHPSNAPALRAEADGLRALSEGGILRVPRVLGLGEDPGICALVSEALEDGRGVGDDAWARFGEELARHHAHGHGPRYGWHTGNFIGATPQPNDWCDDWVEFNTTHRIGHQLRLARDAGRLDRTGGQRVQRVIDRLPRLIPARPHPALLHGDLWSGNVIADRCGGRPRLGVIDPAVSVGDGWADIAMLRLFGPPPRMFEEAYAAHAADRDGPEQRVRVYQLYHMLNHLNLFGGGYLRPVMRLASSLEG